MIDPARTPHFLELYEDFPEGERLLLDQETTTLRGLTEDQRAFREQGYLIKRGFIPEQLVD